MKQQHQWTSKLSFNYACESHLKQPLTPTPRKVIVAYPTSTPRFAIEIDWLAGRLSQSLGIKYCQLCPEKVVRNEPLTLPNPILLTPARNSMRLRCGSGEVRMPAPVGPFFWPSPFWPLDDFWFFFLLNLGSTAPNYPRRPRMRSSKTPPNQKNRGQFLPQPTRTHRRPKTTTRH